ncbi:MAG: nucleotidyltransferase domain-containing protein, partial [Acidobacteria bacterium]|nr:nucleotidyltransferase domain-containing protein [Acidobacteriota bacterium]
MEIRDLLRKHGNSYPRVSCVASVGERDHIAKSPGFLLDFETDRVVVTFEGLISDTGFVAQVRAILQVLQQRLGIPVDIEFASDGDNFYLLQCRPQSYGGESAPASIPQDVPKEKCVFTARRYVSNGRVPDITHVVYVDPDKYSDINSGADLLAVGRCIGRLNQILPKRQFILMGPGRWGSRGDIRLGVNVTYSDINNTAMLIEIARKRGNYVPDLSFGTHFFQDLVEASIRYLPLYPDEPEIVFNQRWLRGSPNELATVAPEFGHLADVVRVIDVAQTTGGLVLRVLMNADLDEAIGMLAEPGKAGPGRSVQRPAPVTEPAEDHWRWRLRMAERIAEQMDAARFGVKTLYLIGSTKNATAGPASDIDLLVHFAGSGEQRETLRVWLEGWSRCLGEVNYLRTGYKSDGLLDVQIITDDDIARKNSYAVKIGAVTDA